MNWRLIIYGPIDASRNMTVDVLLFITWRNLLIAFQSLFWVISLDQICMKHTNITSFQSSHTHLKKLWEKDAALVAYHTDEMEDWLFSLVRMDYRPDCIYGSVW